VRIAEGEGETETKRRRETEMMQQQMAAYASTTISTELIQKYLDENKQLILAILDNQNLGKLNECATYQAKLQQNLMYLAAIADAQPQAVQSSSQVLLYKREH
jgi:hypothetical protein